MDPSYRNCASLTGAADEGIWMTSPSSPASVESSLLSSDQPAPPQAPPPLQALMASCSSSSEPDNSEGYSTSQSQDSLISSDTISLADDSDEASDSAATEEEAAAEAEESGAAATLVDNNDSPPSVMDSLSLALRELSTDKLAAQVQSQSHLPTPLKLVLGSKPPGKKSKQLQQQQQRRSSSMKSHKTPPDTPNQMKKVVRFADAFGLDLAYVKHVFDTEKPPVVPPQAMQDLNLPELESDGHSASTAVGGDGRLRLICDLPQPQQLPRRPFISPCFAQPGISANFASRVAAQKVVLERASGAAIAAAGSSQRQQIGTEISGLVRVSNVGFEKSVLARVSLDGWRTTHDVPAEYVPDSSTGTSDQFAFTIRLPGHFGIGDRAVFCVRYEVCGEVYWDNNFGDNYAFDCFAVSAAGNGRGGDASGPGWAAGFQ